VFHGEADENVDWEAGDVIVRVRSRKAERTGVWSRKEGGILGRVTLSVAEVSLAGSSTLGSFLQALLGFERTLTHLDGRTISLGRKGTTQPGEVEVIEGEGVSWINTFVADVCRCPNFRMYLRATCILNTR